MITEELKDQIIKDYNSGISQYRIIKNYNLPRGIVRGILTDRSEYYQEYYKRNIEKLKLRSLVHYHKNKHLVKRVRKPGYSKEYYDKNKTILNLKRKIRLGTDINFRLSVNLRRRLWHIFKGNTKSQKTLDLLGCDIEHLKLHLSSKFKSGMSWDNYGINGWEIDHIRPCASFNLSNPEEQKRCFHYTNLQPLWKIENLKKHANFS